MTKINWAQKWSSRKFQAMVVTFLVSMLVLFGVAEADIVKISAVVTNALVVIAYIYTEGKVDTARAINQEYVVIENVTDQEE